MATARLLWERLEKVFACIQQGLRFNVSHFFGVNMHDIHAARDIAAFNTYGEMIQGCYSFFSELVVYIPLLLLSTPCRCSKAF